MTTTTQREHDRPGPYRVLGTRPIRHDGLDKVTGVAKYGADIQLPGMLHGMTLRSHTPTPVSALSIRQSHRPARGTGRGHRGGLPYHSTGKVIQSTSDEDPDLLASVEQPLRAHHARTSSMGNRR